MTNEEIEEYSNLIHSLTHYFEGYKNKEDLYQAGIIGLLEAHKHFNSDYNTKFSTYAYTYILGEMKKLVREDKGIKISRNITKLNLKIEKAKILLTQRLMRIPSSREIADFLELEEKDIIECQKTINIMQSLDEPINSEGKELTLYDTISDNSMDLTTLIALKQELNNLTEEEKLIINNRYINDLSQSEVASLLGISQVKVSREEKKIKQKIKSKLAS